MLALLLALALLIGNLYPVPNVQAEEETQVQQTVVQQEQQSEEDVKQEEVIETPSDTDGEEVTEVLESSEFQEVEEEISETVEANNQEEKETEVGEANVEEAKAEVISQSITGSYLGVKTEAKVYNDFTNDIWLQYQQKEMRVGDTASLRPWRVEQIVTDTINNDVARPNFHFEIIAGDSVSLNTSASTEKATVTAVKPGTSIVKVTYDALDYKGQHWNGISPVNTAYAVFTVGETGKAVINTTKDFQDWRHYDTIYYKEGNTVPYRFTVDTQNAASVKVTCNGLEIAGNGKNYTANLENRSNIIGIETTDADGNVKSMWRVIDARFIEVNVANKTNPSQPLKAGETATVSFKGITMPVYKLATIYNPCMDGWGAKSTRVQYHNAKLGDFEGICKQWDLAARNSFDVTFPESGEYTFTSANGIYCEWWGSPLGADITANGSGEPNLNAPVLKDNFSKLPDFTVTVGKGEGEGGGEEKPEEPESNVVIQPSEIHAGDEVTVTIKNIEKPAKLSSPVHTIKTKYNTDIPGLEAIESKEAKGNMELLKTLTFVVPKETPIGVYHLTGGKVYAEHGGLAQLGYANKKKENFFEGELPDIEIEVKEPDEVIAQRVIDKIDSLGEILSILQEDDVRAAREDYEALTDAQEDLVSNLLDLEAAERKIEELKEMLKPNLPIEPENPQNPNPPVNPEKPEKPQPPQKPQKPEKPQTPQKPEIPTKPDVQDILDKTKPSGVLGTVAKSIQKSGEAASVKKESNMIDAKTDNGIVSKSQIKAIAGKDKNLRIRGEMEDGTTYTMILNGKDVKTASDICTTITRNSMYEEQIRLLAPEPEILVFENKGRFSGELMTEVFVNKEDGVYLLFRYDEENEKAVYIQKVTVKDKKVKFLVEEGGSYFIDKKAKVKTVSEIKEAEMRKEPEQKELDTKAVETQSVTGNADKTSHRPLYIFIGIAAAAGIFITGYLTGHRRKGK